jgi:hypothetical protein
MIAACCESHGWKSRIWELAKFIISGLSSTLVMVHLSRSKQKAEEQIRMTHPSLLSHSAFQALILVEHVILVSLPFATNSTYYPPLDCFPNDSRTNAVGIVIIAWLVGALAQGVHYKYCTPMSDKFGPQAKSSAQINCLATLCWKSEVHEIELNLPHCTSCR